MPAPKTPTPEYETTVGESRKAILTDRPAETGGALLLLPATYGALVEIGVPAPWSWIIAVAAAFVPYAISYWRDGQRAAGDPGDHVASGAPTRDPAADARHEHLGLSGVPPEHHGT